MVKKSEELLPIWQLLWNFSCILDFKGFILTNPKELLLKKRPVLRGFPDILDLRERLRQTFQNCRPVRPFLKSFSSSLLILRERLWQTPKNCPQIGQFLGVSPILDLRERFWQTLKNCSLQWTFLECFPNLLVVRDIIVDKSAHSWDSLRFKGSGKPLQNTQTNKL